MFFFLFFSFALLCLVLGMWNVNFFFRDCSDMNNAFGCFVCVDM